MKKITAKIIIKAIAFLLAVGFVIKFGGNSILRLYVETGIGSCHKQPIFCIGPVEEISNPSLDGEYLKELVQQDLLDMEISIPKNFTVIKGDITKTYHKKKKLKYNTSVIHLLYEKPNFFINLFPDLTKKGIKNDYEFIAHTMQAKTKDIKNVTDAFFTIMKSIFIPDMGDQKNIKIVRFSGFDKKGFIAYNISTLENYFDCNLIDKEGNFLKVYIKDKPASLDLNKVFTILSTLKKVD